MKRTYKLFCLAGLMTCLPYAASAQFSSMVSMNERLQREASALFARQDYAAARQTLVQLIKQENPQATGEDIDYMLAMTACRLKMPNRLEVLNGFHERYPDSRYEDAIQAAFGSIYYEEGKYQEAVAYLRTANLNLIAGGNERLNELATAYFELKEYKEARSWFAALSLDKTFHNRAVYYMAYIDYLEKRFDMAYDGFASLKQIPEYAEIVPFYLADIHWQRGESDAATSLVNQYLQAFPNGVQIAQMLRIKGLALFQHADYVNAASVLEQYRERAKQPYDRNALYAQGMSYFHTGAYAKAGSLLGEVTEIEDALAQKAYYNLGLAGLALKNRNQARMAFEQASSSNYDAKIKEEALYNYALLIHETSYSAFAESVTIFERFLNTYPNSVYADRINRYLVEVYMQAKNYEVALASIAKIKNPGKPILQAKQKILFNLGAQLFAQSDFVAAGNRFKQAIDMGNLQPDVQANAYYWLAETDFRREAWTDATAHFKRYMDTPSSGLLKGMACYNLGYVAFKQERYEEALPWFERSVKVAGVDTQVLADAYNRIGDCLFYNRRFDAAVAAYEKARQADVAQGAYALMQMGFVKGLQKQYAAKVQILNEVIANYPGAEYLDRVLFEQGRAFVQMEETPEAIERYNLLIEKFPKSVLAQKAAIEVALLHYQNDQYEPAIAAYKKVIEKYPGSDEAKVAQRDLKSLYVEINRVNEYLSYVDGLPGGSKFDTDEKDSLTYTAAENVYMKGRVAEAASGFKQYLETFPNGAFRLNAAYHLGLIAYNQKHTDEAMTYLEEVLRYPTNKFSGNAMAIVAEISFSRKDFEKALKYYKEWANRVTDAERITALEGAMKSAYALNDAATVIAFADELQRQNKLLPEKMIEATYYKAKSALVLKDTKLALDEFIKLAADTRTVYGAEAKYQVGQLYYDTGQYKQAEKEMLSFIDASTPHAYWLARGFILLSDVYVKQGQTVMARQYLRSLKQNYKAQDDIAAMIENRLLKLK